jgi:hypothetical protein
MGCPYCLIDAMAARYAALPDSAAFLRLADQLAAVTLERNALRAELQALRAAQEKTA